MSVAMLIAEVALLEALTLSGPQQAPLGTSWDHA